MCNYEAEAVALLPDRYGYYKVIPKSQLLSDPILGKKVGMTEQDYIVGLFDTRKERQRITIWLEKGKYYPDALADESKGGGWEKIYGEHRANDFKKIFPHSQCKKLKVKIMDLMFKTLTMGKKYLEKSRRFRLGSYKSVGIFQKSHVIVGLGSNGFIITDHLIKKPYLNQVIFIDQSLFDYFIDIGNYEGQEGFDQEMIN